jgi:hypothetical protein
VKDEYRTKAVRAVKEARHSLAELFRQREALDIAIAKQQRRAAALAALVDESEEGGRILELEIGGITDAIRNVLRAACPGKGLTAKEIKIRLSELHFPVNEYQNFMSSLGSVLRRLIGSGEVRKAIIDTHDGRHTPIYRWVQKYGATNRLANMMLSQLETEQSIPPTTEGKK